MSKRFTDTDKWKKTSFSDLSMKMKLVWIYLCDNCDHAGIWDANLRLLSFHLGEEVTRDEIDAALGDKVYWLTETKIFLPSFIEFQYGTLNPENRVHQSVIARIKLTSECAIEGAYKPLIRSLEEAKDKDKEKDKEKEKEKECAKFDFEEPYHAYPRKLGKAQGMKRLESMVKDQETYDAFCRAVQNYARMCQGKDPNYIKHWSSFVGTANAQTWRDYVDIKPELVKPAETHAGAFARIVED